MHQKTCVKVFFKLLHLSSIRYMYIFITWHSNISRMSSNGPNVSATKPGFGLTLQRSHSGLSYSGPDSPVFLDQPPWSPDIQKCEECNRDFDFFVRRHHCRRCGRCLCERYVAKCKVMGIGNSYFKNSIQLLERKSSIETNAISGFSSPM